jgi:protoporphyrinogen oxidase
MIREIILQKRQALILGAGITGLTTAWKLVKNGFDVIVIEKESQVGGLAGTIDWDGWKFDFGAHCFHTKNQDITDFYKELLSDKFSPINPIVKLYAFKKLIAYPFVGAHIFFVLDRITMLKAGVDFFLTRLKALLFGIKDTERLDEWIIWRFGRVLYNLYFSRYIERIQKADPKYLSKDLGEKKIPVFSIRQYIQRELFRRSKADPGDVTQLDYYYVRGGYGEIAQYFCNEIVALGGKIHLNETIQHIDVEDGEAVSIETGNGSYDCGGCPIISTIPIKALVRSIKDCDKDVLKAQEDLESSRMRFLLVKIKKSKVMGYRWVNFSDTKFPFYRVSEYCYDKYKIVPEGHCSLIFEIPLNEQDQLWSIGDRELADTVIPLFNEVFALSLDDIIDVRSIYADNASPRMSIRYREALILAFQYLDGIHNLYSIGRQGLFTYINLDGCTKMGVEFADSVIDGRGKQKNRELLKSLHGI